MLESSSAIIEQNTINKNLLANIALGGKFNSEDTFIVNNNICESLNEGIAIINSNNVWILRNKIYQNNDGIVTLKSNPIIENNEIYENLGNGLFLL